MILTDRSLFYPDVFCVQTGLIASIWKLQKKELFMLIRKGLGGEFSAFTEPII